MHVILMMAEYAETCSDEFEKGITFKSFHIIARWTKTTLKI